MKALVQLVMELPVFGRSRPEGKVLEAVGVFEAVKQHGKYETGQVRMDSTAAGQHTLPSAAFDGSTFRKQDMGTNETGFWVLLYYKT